MKTYFLTRIGHAIVQEVLAVKAETLEEAKKRWAEGDFDTVISPIEENDIDWTDTVSEEWEEEDKTRMVLDLDSDPIQFRHIKKEGK